MQAAGRKIGFGTVLGLCSLRVLSRFCWIFLVNVGLFIGSASAALKIQAVNGRSEFDNTAGLTQPIIFGGVAGNLNNCNQTINTRATCDSCTVDIEACNTRRIYDDLILEVIFQIDTISDGNSGPVRAFVTSGTTTEELELENGSSTNVGKDSDAILLATWQEICQTIAKNGETTCEGFSLDGVMSVGIDANNDGQLSSEESGNVSFKVSTPTAGGAQANEMPLCGVAAATDAGICEWEAFPGDEKVFMESLQAADDFPNAVDLNYDRVRVMVSEVGFADANPAPLPLVNSAEFKIETNSSDNEFDLDTDSLPGLKNGQFYYFRLGVLDPANNLAFITSDDAIIALCTASGSGTIDEANASGDAVTLATLDEKCPFMAFPDEVYGLWEENLNCFIATVAYGSTWATKVQSFRNFRNQFLLPTIWGKKIVRKYYYHGRKAAHWVHNNPVWRGPLRIALWPVWVAVEVALQWGLWMGGVFAGLSLILCFGGLWLGVRWVNRHKFLLFYRRQ